MNMNIYTDPEPLTVDTVVDFQGLLARVSVLENEFRILFRSFEEKLEDKEETFNAEILKFYNQESVYFVLGNEDENENGLLCRLLNSTNTQWIDGRLHFQPTLVFRQTPEKDYRTTLIPYDPKTIIQIGHKTITVDAFLKPYLNDLKSREKQLSNDLREFLEKENKSFISPQTISECVDVEILQPGQDWVSCKMDLQLTLRLYQAEVKNHAWQAIYYNSLKLESPKMDSLVQIGECVISIYDLCCQIANKFGLFEQEYKGNNRYYPDCPTLENKIVSQLRMSSYFNLLRGKIDAKGLPCKLLQLTSGHWVEGDLAFELMPQFIPNVITQDISSDPEVTERYESPLDDIRQDLLNNSEN